MFSGKTSTVVHRIKRARLGGRDVVYIRHVADTRFGGAGGGGAGGAAQVYTHDGPSIAEQMGGPSGGALRIVAASELRGVELGPAELDVGVDEGQFFPDLREALDLWMREGRRVYVAALSGDFNREVFPPVAAALPLATAVVKLSAVCMVCAEGGAPPAEAHYNLRLSADREVVLVGGRELYRAVCQSCYEGVVGAGSAPTPG